MDYAKQEAPQSTRQSEIGSEIDSLNGNIGRLETAFTELDVRIHQIARDSTPEVKESEKQPIPQTKLAQELRACNERIALLTVCVNNLRNRIEL